MASGDAAIFCTTKPYPFFGAFPERAELLYYALTAFEIPTMPILTADYRAQRAELMQSLLRRFQRYLCELHSPESGRAVALQFMCHPQASEFQSRVRAYVLCRSAAAEVAPARADVDLLARQALERFPTEAPFSFGTPRWTTEAELNHILFRDLEAFARPAVVELRKHEDFRGEFPRPQMRYVAHRFWPDTERDPWIALIETLSRLRSSTAVRIELTPVSIRGTADEADISNAGRWFGLLAEDLERKASHGEQIRTDGVITEEMLRSGDLQIASDSATNVAFVKRGKQVLAHWLANSDHLFSARVLVAAVGDLPASVIGGVRAALSDSSLSAEGSTFGWVRPRVVSPGDDELRDALSCLEVMADVRWGDGDSGVDPGYRKLRSLVTPEEAVSLFHLPIYDRAGQTSALSTADYPFVIPPEVLSRKRLSAEELRLRPEERSISIGHLYQRERLLKPGNAGQSGVPFEVTIGDLMKPSLLVGAPGSGKTSLAMSLMVQLWHRHGIPFLVLDPSTGQEFRMLLSEPSLKRDVICYTIGDTDAAPLQFNPFAVPPGVTVRNHITRILAAFKAAFECPDPVPAIYEAALERLYTDERYAGSGRKTELGAKADMDSAAPTLSGFAAAIQDEVKQTTETLYQGSKEALGVIRGASTIRVNAIGKKLGFIMNTPTNNCALFQRLLQRPAVIELGALGDSSNIALVMAFLLAQLAGHIEYGYRQHSGRQHIVFIEEAHRLLAAGNTEGAGNKSAEDINVMLAEMRKFGQGILVMDQRPSSLVGGVLDNAYVKILTRLSDRVGFDRLSDELNLNEDHQRFARTRLRAGEAILLDRGSGQPVLMLSENAKGEIEKQRSSAAEELRQNRANMEKAELVPPPAERYVEPNWQAGSSAASSGAEAKDWLTGRVRHSLETLLAKMRADGVLYHTIKRELATSGKTVSDAQRIAAPLIEKHRDAYQQLVERHWRELTWAITGTIAKETSGPEAQRLALAQGEAAPCAKPAAEPVATPAGKPAAESTTNPAAQPVSKPAAKTFAQHYTERLSPVMSDLTSGLVNLLLKAREGSVLWWAIRTDLAVPSGKDAKAVAAGAMARMAADRSGYEALTNEAWQRAVQALVELIGAEQVNEATARAILTRSKRARPEKVTV
jgi:hypothetical protein